MLAEELAEFGALHPRPGPARDRRRRGDRRPARDPRGARRRGARRGVAAGAALRPGRSSARPSRRREDERDPARPGALPRRHRAAAAWRTPRSCAARTRTRAWGRSACPRRSTALLGGAGRPPSSRPRAAASRCSRSRARRSPTPGIRCWRTARSATSGSRSRSWSPESRALAEDAAELVEVDYEPLEAVVDPRASEHAWCDWSRSAGDVEERVRGRRARRRRGATAAARSSSARSRRAARSPRTTPATGCSPSGARRRTRTGRRAQLSHVLGRPDDTIRVIVPDVGGAFGTKGVVGAEVAAVAVAAIDLGRPVKWAEDRLENLLRPPTRAAGCEADVELALDAEGTMLGVRARILRPTSARTCTRRRAIPPHTAGDAHVRRVRHPGRGGGADRRAHRQGADRAVPGRRAPGGGYFLERAVDDAARTLGHRPRRAAPAQPRARVPAPHAARAAPTTRATTSAAWTSRSSWSSHERRRGRPRAVRAPGSRCTSSAPAGMWESAEATVEPSGRVVDPQRARRRTARATRRRSRRSPPTGSAIADGRRRAALRRQRRRAARRSGRSRAARPRWAARRSCSRSTGSSRGRACSPRTCSAARRTTSCGRTGELRAGRRATIALREVAAAAYQPRELPPGVELGLAGERRASARRSVSVGRATPRSSRSSARPGMLSVLHLAAVDDGGHGGQPAARPRPGRRRDRAGPRRVPRRGGRSTTRPASCGPRRSPTTACSPRPRCRRCAIGVVETPSPHNPLGAKGARRGRRDRLAARGRQRGRRRARRPPRRPAVHAREALARAPGGRELERVRGLVDARSTLLDVPRVGRLHRPTRRLARPDAASLAGDDGVRRPRGARDVDEDERVVGAHAQARRGRRLGRRRCPARAARAGRRAAGRDRGRRPAQRRGVGGGGRGVARRRGRAPPAGVARARGAGAPPAAPARRGARGGGLGRRRGAAGVAGRRPRVPAAVGRARGDRRRSSAPRRGALGAAWVRRRS